MAESAMRIRSILFMIACTCLMACEASVEAGYRVEGGYDDNPVGYLYVTNASYDYFSIQYEGDHNIAICDGWDTWDAGWVYAIDSYDGYELSLLAPGAQTCLVIMQSYDCDDHHCPFTLVGVPYLDDPHCSTGHANVPCVVQAEPNYRHTVMFTNGPYQEAWVEMY